MSNFHRAARSVSKLRLAISGPAGSGKTYSALLIASGITSIDKVAVIDTENGSADLYANLGPYGVLTMTPPYTVDKYIAAIHEAEQAGFELVIIDSLSHAWSGEGGLLEQKDMMSNGKYKGNGWAAWSEITPLQNRLIETMLHSSIHVIATMRSKTEYAQEDNGGKKRIVKLGMAPIQRDGVEYEFTAVFDMSIEHVASVNKDRTNLFDGQCFIPNKQVGEALKVWLDGGNGAGNNNFVPAGSNQSDQTAQGAHNSEPQQQQEQNPTQHQAQQVNSHQQSGGRQQGIGMGYEIIQYIWHQKQWPADKICAYIEGRWQKSFTDVTSMEMDTLANELCDYVYMDRIKIEDAISESIPF